MSRVHRLGILTAFTNRRVPPIESIQAPIRFLAILVTTALIGAVQVSRPLAAQDLGQIEQSFDEMRGQLQVGGPFAGLEFHHSRPAPSRISFYYPVANSIDLSTDYWRRDVSLPLDIVVRVDGQTDTVTTKSSAYRFTPAGVTFDVSGDAYRAEVSYRFAEHAPYFVFSASVRSLASRDVDVELQTGLDLVLRTSHTYDFRHPDEVYEEKSSGARVGRFREPDTGPASIFVLDAGSSATPSSSLTQSRIASSYSGSASNERAFNVTQIIGSASPADLEDVVAKARASWQREIDLYEQRVADHALRAAPFTLSDSVLVESARWSKALLQANRHYLDGQVVPMPCPAQYNFFFTHDLLLTDLGAVFFDAERVQSDLQYLAMLAGPDSLLPHAYYWKDGEYVTEMAGSDNWNHFWFVLLSSSYLKHTDDVETIEALWPMLFKSVTLMLENEHEGLMHAERPDWWDIGHVYGARAYTTMLAIRTVRAYAYLVLRLGKPGPDLPELLARVDRMQVRLVEVLWNDEAGFLLNRIEGDEIDRHYYSGSLLGAAFDLLEPDKKARLLDTAERVLLDPEIGIRNAMPTDFEDLVERYRFRVGEVGAPFRYMNGGVWPQGTAWYIKGLIASGRPDSALRALKRFLTIDGIRNSPNGQPSYYEYRHADPQSADYGRIDKTTFLWAGGWYLNVLYELLGARESEWNVAFDPELPSELEDVEYSMLIGGRLASVHVTGNGRYYQRIETEGRRTHSAVFSEAVDEIRLLRGRPEHPYLSAVSGIARSVEFDDTKDRLTVEVTAFAGQSLQARFVSPNKPASVRVDASIVAEGPSLEITEDEGTFVTVIRWQAISEVTRLDLRF